MLETSIMSQFLEALAAFSRANPTTAGMVIISASGAFGGIVYGMASPTQYQLRVPFSQRTHNLGFIGDAAVGVAASFMVLFVVAAFLGSKSFTFEEIGDLLRVISLSLLSGYAGIKLLSRASDRISDEIVSKVAGEIKQSEATITTQLNSLERLELEQEIELYIREGQLDIALMSCARMSEKFPEAEAAFILKAKVFRRQGMLGAAILELDTVIGRNQKSARALYNRACYRQLAGHKKADVLLDLESAIRNRPLYRNVARLDSDFAGIRTDSDFKHLVGAAESGRTAAAEKIMG